MRLLVLVFVLAMVTDPASALVIEEPGIQRLCGRASSWEAMTKCLGQHGKPTVIRTLPGAKLVRMSELEGSKWIDSGVYLFVERKQEWRMAGTFFGGGSTYEILRFEALTIGTHTGHRIDIGQATPVYVRLDGETNLLAVRRAYSTMLCGGESPACTAAVVSCEVLLHGRAYYTFRGVMSINGNEVTVKGDRRNAGPFCAQAERLFLGWPQQPKP